MDVRKDIEQHASETDKPILLWLFERYHWESEWRPMAKSHMQKYGDYWYQYNRVWSPTTLGLQTYYWSQLRETLQRLLKEGTGSYPEPSQAAVAARKLLEQTEFSVRDPKKENAK